MTELEDRPAPEALLDEASRARQGKLKIFLGAFPGAGKTYAMLQAAQAHLIEGVDVVAGVVETHGRAETEALHAAHRLQELRRRARHAPGTLDAQSEMVLGRDCAVCNRRRN